eukprot:766203-Hanusia_phi.AAC.9
MPGAVTVMRKPCSFDGVSYERIMMFVTGHAITKGKLYSEFGNVNGVAHVRPGSMLCATGTQLVCLEGRDNTGATARVVYDFCKTDDEDIKQKCGRFYPTDLCVGWNGKIFVANSWDATVCNGRFDASSTAHFEVFFDDMKGRGAHGVGCCSIDFDSAMDLLMVNRRNGKAANTVMCLTRHGKMNALVSLI